MNSRRTVIGVFLILFGGMIFLGNLGFTEDTIVLGFISIGFLFIYFLLGAWKRRANIGFLIPGVIMGVIALYVTLEDFDLIPQGADPLFLVLLGAGFLLIMFIHTMRINSASWGEKYWPVFPGGILVMVGAIALTTDADNKALSLVTPSMLVLIGVYLIYSQIGSTKGGAKPTNAGKSETSSSGSNPQGSIRLQKKTDSNATENEEQGKQE